MSDIERNIVRLHRSLAVDEHHRYRSWEHCYRYFRQRRHLRADRDIDHAALQLGFYLASWGMYRGSSFLLWTVKRLQKAAEMTQDQLACRAELSAAPGVGALRPTSKHAAEARVGVQRARG
jgi:hypothetical protein